MRYLPIILLLALGIAACSDAVSKPEALPIMGNHDIDPATGDTTFHHIRPFAFVDQDSQIVNNATFEGKAYVADFFFTSCPTICPRVKQQMLRIYDRYQDDDRLLLLSHTIDVKHDTVGRLKEYAEGLGVSSDKWHFVTGDKDEIYGIAEDYLSIAREDPDAPGGFDHSGWVILVDQKGRIRSFANGTIPEKMDELMEDIDWLLNNEFE
ncbi:MAG: SCO family protein [Saprospiraceae bacterium]|nr:SCO family protein [Lewinella sp.]